MKIQPPPEFDLALHLLDGMSLVHRPTFLGFDQIPDERPLLFVGNHTLLGFLDIPLFFRELWREKGIFLNALGDRVHFRIPGWGHVLRRYGAVEGSPGNCAELFRQGATVLVFPGGAREVCKHRDELHQLVWGNRSGFARLATQHDVTVVPFSMVGVEDALDIVMDEEEYAKSMLGSALDRLGIRRDLRTPIVRGVGPLPLPRPERYDYKVMRPLRPSEFASEEDPIWALREATREQIEQGISDLMEIRMLRSLAQR